ncbi:MAG: ABC transporter permease [Oscillospiraceae bacterium]|nr:ABC transporter permease [Oscillospiraceae bacterium]MCI8943722.1 ABC transporter permease [Oscillospiraceae bacterium]
MFSHGFMSFAAVGITVACLLIMGTFTLVAVNANAMLAEMESQNQMLAFVDKSLSEDEARAMEQVILSLDNVAKATFISNEEAAAAFRGRYEDDELFQGLPDDNFRHRYAIDLKDIGYMRQTKEALEAVPGIGRGNVSAYEDEAAGFITIRNVAGVVCVVLIAVLFLVSVFIIANTIKLTTFDRRDEIAIMKMVGATNGFIRWPFVYEGFLLGLFSAVIGFFLQWGLYEAVARSVASNDTINLISVVPFQSMWTYVAVIFAVAGMLIGVGGSLSAIRKFLQV